MSIEIVVGANWGDEGKGRMVDYLAQNADFVVRFQGGNNAGHTVVNEFGLFKLHLLPSGVFNPKAINILGPGMVIDLQGLAEELADLKSKGIDPQIRISDRATICFPFHRLQDAWEEDRLGAKAYGSTRRGIAPAYGDRTVKKGIQIGERLPDDPHTRGHPLLDDAEWDLDHRVAVEQVPRPGHREFQPGRLPWVDVVGVAGDMSPGTRGVAIVGISRTR